jgi:hypothetical protein
MIPPTLREKLKRLPFARRVERHLLGGGHTAREAEAGALLVAGLDILLFVVLLNTFAWGLLLSLTKDVSAFMKSHPAESVLAGFLLAILLVSLVFRFMKGEEDRRAEEERQARRQETALAGKRDAVRRGAMSAFEEVFRSDLARKRPDVQLLSVTVVDTTPRIRFRMARFVTEKGGDVDANYRLFREKLFGDSLALVRIAFELSPNIPAVGVDAVFNFISRKAQFYDGAVLSVKATREVYRTLDLENTPAFKALNAFDLRYNDGLEVEAHPEEVSKSAQVLERLHRSLPRVEIRYDAEVPKPDDGWRTVEDAPPVPVVTAADAGAPTDPSRLPADRFQSLVRGMLAAQGFVVSKTRKIPGGTLEFLSSHPHPLLGGDHVVLARQYPENAQVHAEMVSELDQLVGDEGCQRGIYVVTGRFTDEAVNIALHMPVTLVDGRRLKELLSGTAPAAGWEGFRGVTPGRVPDLNGMPLTAFLETVEGFLRGLGFDVRKVRRLTDGAVFARIVDPHPLIGGEFAVLARQVPSDREIAAEVVREMGRVMEAEFCRRGLLMATGPFSAEARTLARSLAVELVERSRWAHLFGGPAGPVD